MRGSWVCVPAVLAGVVAVASAQGPRPQQGTLKVGAAAPTFELGGVEGDARVKLADLKGKPVVLVFGSCT